MRKYIRTTALAMALSLVLSIPAFAADEHREGKTDWQVAFTKDKEMVSNFKTQEIDDAIYAMEPGDDVKFTLSLTNQYKETTDWYMENEVLKSLENSQKVANGGAYTYRLVYNGPSGSKVLYDSEQVGGSDASADTAVISGAGEEGLHQATSSLKNYFYLDRLKSGQAGEIELLVMLEGESLTNSYQDTLARLQMNFAVELVGNRTTSPRTTVKTGDYVHMLLWAGLALLSGLFCILIIILTKHQKKQNKKQDKKRRGGRGNVRGLLLFAILSAATLSCIDAKAAEGDNLPSYEYTITFSSGKEGTFGGGERIVRTAKYGDVISFNAVANTTVKNPDKYYVRGIKKSGQDNNQKLANSSFVVTEDADYVVAYGATGSMVAYTVEYVDRNGNVLANPETYYGNVGDKPVVAYLYVDGYQPQAQNLTKTLSADSAQNVFRFEYTQIPSSQIPSSQNATVGNVQGNTGNPQGTTQSGNAGDGVVIAPQTPTEDNGENQSQDNEAQETEDPKELVNLDETEVPLENVGLDKERETSGLHSTRKLPMVIAGVAVVLAMIAMAGLWYVLGVKKKGRRDDGQR